MRIIAYGNSDKGKVRENNEDNFLILNLSNQETGNIEEPLDLEKGAYLVVADGMGGAAAGETAALQVVEAAGHCGKLSRLSPKEINLASVLEAQRRCLEIVRSEPRLLGMGSVATYSFIQGNKAYISQVGDTRFYLYRNKSLELITEDQNYVAEMVKLGIITPEQASFHPQRNAVTQAIGAVDDITPVTSELELQVGDILLLCSDGLSGMVSPVELQMNLDGSEDLQDLLSILIDTANANGGHDNITAIIAKIME
jgi:PPM family protein phosphatase